MWHSPESCELLEQIIQLGEIMRTLESNWSQVKVTQGSKAWMTSKASLVEA